MPEYDVPFPEVLKDDGPAFPEVEAPKQEAASDDVPFPEVAKPKKKSVTGFLGNVIPSAFHVAKDIGESIAMAPIHGAKAVADVMGENFKNNPGQWVKNPETGRSEKRGLLNISRGGGYDSGDFWNELGKGYVDTGKDVWKALYQKYQDRYDQQPADKKSWINAVVDTSYEDPVGVALDASVVKDIAVAPFKAVGKLGDKAAIRAAEGAMGALKPGPKAIQAGLEATAAPNLAQRVGSAAQAVDTVGTDLAGKAFKKAGSLVGIDTDARKATLQLKGEELSRVPVKQAEDYDRLLTSYKVLGPDERAAVAEVQRLGEGATPEALQAVRSNPVMRKIVDDYAGFLKGEREKFLQDANLLDKPTLQRRVEAQYALEKYGDMEPASMAKARKDIGKMREFKPQYVPSEAEIREGNGILDGLWGGKDEKMLGAPSVGRLGKVKFLEKFTGKAGISTDPLEYTKRLIDSYRKVEGNVRWLQRIESNPDLVKAVSRAELKDIIPTEGIYRKYLQNGGKDRARALYQMQLEKEHGSAKAMEMLQKDPATIKTWKGIAGITANDTVRKILSLEFSKWGQQPGAALRAYENVIGLFRKGATKYNPHYYTGNAVGDAILSLMDGVGPRTLGLADKLKEYSPFQARRTASVNAEGLQTGKLGKLYDYINEVDAAGKRGIIVKETAAKLKDIGISKAQMEDALKEVLPSIEKLGDAEVARIQLHERIAKKVESLHGNKLSPKAKATMTARLEAEALDAGVMEKQVSGLAQSAEIVRPAVARANSFFADYVGMGPVEQYLFRRLIPFYAFNKSMAMLAFKLPFIAPKMTFLWNRYATMMQGMTADPDAPPGYIPFGVSKEGKVYWVSAKGLSPFGGLRMSRSGGMEHPELLDFWRQNPILSTIATMKGEKNQFSKASIPYGTLITGVHNGAVYEYQEDGSVKKVIDEPPLVQTLAHYFPIVGTIERALFPYQLTKEGFLNYWTPEKNFAGEYKYPNASLLPVVGKPDQAMGNVLGVKTIEKSRSELQMAKVQREKMVMKEFEKRIKTTTDPDEREGLIEQFKDWMKTRKVSPND